MIYDTANKMLTNIIKHQSFVTIVPMGLGIAGDIAGLKSHALSSVSSLQCHGTAGLLTNAAVIYNHCPPTYGE